MGGAAGGPVLIEGRVGRKTSNALKITFQDGPGDPLAVGLQGAGDGRGRKMATLFGFKNGGTGNHELRFADGRTLGVASRDKAPTEISGDGRTVATVNRGTVSTVVLADGTELLRFVDDADEAKFSDQFRLRVSDGSGADLGRLDVIRRSSAWSLDDLADVLLNYDWWVNRTGESLPIPLLGTRLLLDRPVDGLVRDVLLAVCVDIAIGLRPYSASMN
jgi:hypothetical protein